MPDVGGCISATCVWSSLLEHATKPQDGQISFSPQRMLLHLDGGVDLGRKGRSSAIYKHTQVIRMLAMRVITQFRAGSAWGTTEPRVSLVVAEPLLTILCGQGQRINKECGAASCISTACVYRLSHGSAPNHMVLIFMTVVTQLELSATSRTQPKRLLCQTVVLWARTHIKLSLVQPLEFLFTLRVCTFGDTYILHNGLSRSYSSQPTLRRTGPLRELPV